MQGALRAVHALLEQERPGGGRRLDRSFGGRVAVGDGDALAARQPVEFHHDRDPELAPPGDGGGRLGEPGEAGAGDAEFGGERPGVGLRRLELGERGGRPEARQSAPDAFVGDARGQGGLGSGDDEIDVGRAGLAEVGGHDHVVAVAAARPGDGRFATAATDDEHPHQAIARSVRSGSGPETNCGSFGVGAETNTHANCGHARTPSNDSFAWASPTASGYFPVKQALQ